MQKTGSANRLRAFMAVEAARCRSLVSRSQVKVERDVASGSCHVERKLVVSKVESIETSLDISEDSEHRNSKRFLDSARNDKGMEAPDLTPPTRVVGEEFRVIRKGG